MVGAAARGDGVVAAELLLDPGAGLGEIHPAAEAFLQRRHHPAHVLERGGAELGDDGVDRLAGLRLVELPRQVALDDGDLLGFLPGKLGPAAALVELDALVALAHHLLHHLDDLGLADAVGDAAAAGGNVAVLERRQDQAQGRHGALVLGLHRLLQRFAKLISQHGRPLHLPLRGRTIALYVTPGNQRRF